MKKKHEFIHNNNEVNLYDVSRKIWKDKILFLLICLILSITSYFFFNLQPKTYKTGVKIREVSAIDFFEYFIISKEINKPIAEYKIDFNKIFIEQLLSNNTLNDFIKNSEMSKLKSNLKDNNIDIRKFSQGNFKIDYHDVEAKKNIKNIYYSYEKNFPGEEILDSYIIFAKNKADKILKRDILNLVKFEIEFYKLNLVRAHKLNIEKLEYYQLGLYSSHPFLYGQQILEIKINFFEDFVKNNTVKVNYNPILEKITPIANFRSVKMNLAFSFTIGLFFSLIIIFIKSWIKEVIFENN